MKITSSLPHRLTEKALTPLQLQVYDWLKAKYAEEWAGIEKERARWGDKSAEDTKKYLETKGVEIFIGQPGRDPLKAPLATWNALEDAGYIKVSRGHGTGNELRHGAFGRWIGGSVNYSYAILHAVPLK